MKKIISLLLTAIMASSITYGQKKNYLSFDAGMSQTGINNRLQDNMKANGLGARIESSFFFFFLLPINSVTQYPVKGNTSSNHKVRYGYNLKPNNSIEFGYGKMLQSWVKGAQSYNDNNNYLQISYKSSTAYAAYMWTTKKQRAAIGLGPSLSFFNIKQEGGWDTKTSNKNYLLPGVFITSYWNFVNRKSWTLGLRNDINISLPAKTAEVKITNYFDPGFVSVSKSTHIGSFVNCISLSGGIKF